MNKNQLSVCLNILVTLSLIFISNTIFAQPVVVRVMPEPNSTGVPLAEKKTIEIEFSEAMDKQSVENAIYISNFENLSEIFYKDQHQWLDDKTLSLADQNIYNLFPFSANTLYTISIGTGAKNLSGIPMQQTYSWQFTTTPPISYSEIKEKMINIYNDEFNIVLTAPPIVGSFDSPQGSFTYDEPYFTSVVYWNNILYRIYMLPDGKYYTKNFPMNILPQGIIDVTVVCVDYGNTNISSIYNNIWVDVQEKINQDLADIASHIGLNSPVVQFNNTNILAPSNEIEDATSGYYVLEFLKTRGLTLDDFDILLVLDLDAQTTEGGSAVPGGRFGYLGNINVVEDFITYDFDRLSSSGRAIYHHEVGHILGWEHEWSYDPNDLKTLLPAPALLGWTDTDGDGIIEILDPTPYGSIDINTNLANLSSKESITVKVVPNPAIDYVSFGFENHNANYEIIISDVSGRIILNEFTHKRSLVEFDLNSVNNGFYIYQIKLGREIINNGKLVKN